MVIISKPLLLPATFSAEYGLPEASYFLDLTIAMQLSWTHACLMHFVEVCVCVCVYVPHNDQLGRTDFPHNALSPQCIVGTYRCVCVCVSER